MKRYTQSQLARKWDRIISPIWQLSRAFSLWMRSQALLEAKLGPQLTANWLLHGENRPWKAVKQTITSALELSFYYGKVTLKLFITVPPDSISPTACAGPDEMWYRLPAEEFWPLTECLILFQVKEKELKVHRKNDMKMMWPQSCWA